MTSATGHDCVICQDPIFDAEVQAPCGHFYDIGCISNLFQSATRDESLYPPQCCRQIIPLVPQVRPHLTQALLAEFELKAEEFGTLKRVYCASPECSRFLGPLCKGFSDKVFTCPSLTCTTDTCGKCRGRFEGRPHSCVPDAETERMLALSSASGWSRCPGCAQMIELVIGCYHMTCRCKTEFCYLCSAPWKTCKCPRWDRNRLVAVAARHVAAQPQPARHAQPANRPRQARAVHRPMAGVDRNRHVHPPRQAPAAAPRPAPAVYVRPTAHHAEALAPAPRNGGVPPFFDARTHTPAPWNGIVPPFFDARTHTPTPVPTQH
jgi:hypothetical protein